MRDAGIGACQRCKVADDVTSVTMDHRILARCWACGHLWSESEAGATSTSPGEVADRQLSSPLPTSPSFERAPSSP